MEFSKATVGVIAACCVAMGAGGAYLVSGDEQQGCEPSPKRWQSPTTRRHPLPRRASPRRSPLRRPNRRRRHRPQQQRRRGRGQLARRTHPRNARPGLRFRQTRFGRRNRKSSLPRHLSRSTLPTRSRWQRPSLRYGSSKNSSSHLIPSSDFRLKPRPRVSARSSKTSS